MRKLLLFLSVFVMLSSFNPVHADSPLDDADTKREKADEKADERLDALREKNDENFESMYEGPNSYDADYFEDDEYSNIFDRITVKVMRWRYRMAALALENLYGIAAVIIIIGILLILVFRRTAKHRAALGMIMIIFGLGGLIIFTFWPIFQKWINT